jgi:hypothetical protein
MAHARTPALYDVGAVIRQPQRDRTTNSLARAGDEGDFPVGVHVDLLALSFNQCPYSRRELAVVQFASYQSLSVDTR